jgi:hypothetical protein
MISDGLLDVGFLRLPLENRKEIEVTTVHRTGRNGFDGIPCGLLATSFQSRWQDYALRDYGW